MEIIVGLFVVYVIYRIIKGLSPSKRASKTPEITVRFEVSGSGGYEDYERLRGKPAKWYEHGNSVTVKDYEISGGLVYAGEMMLDADGYEYDNDACLINPKLKGMEFCLRAIPKTAFIGTQDGHCRRGIRTKDREFPVYSW